MCLLPEPIRPKPSRLLRLVTRLNLQLSKQTNLAKAEKRQVATLLREDKEHNARIKVEQIIRTDYKLESFEMLKNYAETLTTRLNVLITQPEMQPEIAEAVTALVYSGYLMGQEIPELKELFNLFAAKYGKAYVEEVIANKDKYLNHRLNKMLSSTQVPDPTVVVAYLTEIAKAYGVEYIPTLQAGIATPLSTTTGISLPLPGQAMDSVSQTTTTTVQTTTVQMPTAQMPTVQMPTTVPMAYGVPTMPPPGAPSVYKVELMKLHPHGFGLLLDTDNVVTGHKTTDVAAKVGIGDVCIAFNDTPVTRDTPVKTLAIDLDNGVTAVFTMARGRHGDLPPPPAAGSSGGAPLPSAAGLYSPEALGGLPSFAPPQPAAQPPPTAVMGYATPPTLPPDSMPVPVAPPAAPAAPLDADDLLAQRLEALKRS